MNLELSILHIKIPETPILWVKPEVIPEDYPLLPSVIPLSLGEADHSCLLGFLLIWNKVIDPSLLCNTKMCNFLDKQNL